MRRSNSSSNIPIRKSQQGLTRTRSFNQLAAPVLSCRSSAPRGSVTPSVPISATKSKVISKRSTCTPLRGHCSTRLASPALALTTQKINDKQFSADQQRKICAFLECALDQFDPKSLKPLSIKAFVDIVKILFHQIDARINITMENYKEIVHKYLKLYKYPGPLSISTLKTVNANHAWPSVMAIFGWLVDLINAINGENLEADKLRLYISSCFMVKLKGREPKGLFVNHLYDLLDIDAEEGKKLAEEVSKLKEKQDRHMEMVSQLNEEKRKLAEKFEQMKLEIQEFEEGTTETMLQQKLEELKSVYVSKQKQLELKKQSIEEKRKIKKTQKYSAEHKMKLTRKAEDIMNTFTLTKERYEHIVQLRSKYDLEATTIRRQIEAAIHKFNNSSLELIYLLPQDDVEQLRLPDKSRYNAEFIKMMDLKKEFLRNLQIKLNFQITKLLEEESEAKEKLKEAENEKMKLEENINNLTHRLQYKSDEIECLKFENNIIQEQRRKKIETLMKTIPDVDMLIKMKLEQLEELKALEKEFDHLSQKSIEFFMTLSKDAKRNDEEMREIMSAILQKSHQALECLRKKSTSIVQNIENSES